MIDMVYRVHKAELTGFAVDMVDRVDIVNIICMVDTVDKVELSLAKPGGGEASRESALPTSQSPRGPHCR